MKELSNIEALRSFLETQPIGPIVDIRKVARLLAICWNQLEGGDATSMQAAKLWRIEDPVWAPPVLEFIIERHGQTVLGSSRATLHRWQVNLQTLVASLIGETRRQINAMDAPLDVKPLVDSLALAILEGKRDDRLRTLKDGSVKLDIARCIPATNKQTTSARRIRLRQHLALALAPYGWSPVRVNVYRKDQRK